MAYHQFHDADASYGSFEVFYADRKMCDQINSDIVEEDSVCPKLIPGWYWQACFPGCLPDSEPWGPFGTEQQAIDDAQECGS